eukprot:1706948-Rhodomonas_salina.1
MELAEGVVEGSTVGKCSRTGCARAHGGREGDGRELHDARSDGAGSDNFFNDGRLRVRTTAGGRDD